MNTMLDAQTVQFALSPDEPGSGSGVHLYVPEGNGIVAADDGEEFLGASVSLPYP